MLLRQTRQISQEQLGARVGVRGQQIHKYETGENRITPERLNFCARVLKVPIGYFYGEQDNVQHSDKVIMTVSNELMALPEDVRKGIYNLTRIINVQRKRDIESIKKRYSS